MDFLDRLSIAPADSTLVQSQSILFAAALFIGCTLFDAQSANHQLDALADTVASAVKHVVAGGAQQAPAAAATAAPRLWMPLRVSVLPQWLARTSFLRSGPACYRAESIPAPLLVARRPSLPATSTLALLD